MKLAAIITTALVGLGIAASSAIAQGPPQPPPIPTPPGPQNPWPGKKAQGLFFYVETVTASPGESIFGRSAPQACTQTNFFARGERVVWHISAADTRTGTIVTNKQVQYSYLKVPGMNNIPVTFVAHGKDPTTAPWTWTARWDVPLNYPLGVVPFTLVMKLKGWTKNKVASWTQIPIPLEQLTIIDHR